MKPPGPVSDVTRMQTFMVLSAQVALLPYEVVATTVCWACGAPAGTNAGPPLSPSHTPGTCVEPPWLDWRIRAVRLWSTGAVAVRRPLLLVVVSVTP
jgi:hypothetical protein